MCPAPALPTRACPASRRTRRLLGLLPLSHGPCHVSALGSDRSGESQGFPARGRSPPVGAAPCGLGGGISPCGQRVPGICCDLSQGSDPSTPHSFSVFTVLESLSGSANRAFGPDTVHAASWLLGSLTGKSTRLRRSPRCSSGRSGHGQSPGHLSARQTGTAAAGEGDVSGSLPEGASESPARRADGLCSCRGVSPDARSPRLPLRGFGGLCRTSGQREPQL